MISNKEFALFGAWKLYCFFENFRCISAYSVLYSYDDFEQNSSLIILNFNVINSELFKELQK